MDLGHWKQKGRREEEVEEHFNKTCARTLDFQTFKSGKNIAEILANSDVDFVRYLVISSPF